MYNTVVYLKIKQQKLITLNLHKNEVLSNLFPLYSLILLIFKYMVRIYFRVIL